MLLIGFFFAAGCSRAKQASPAAQKGPRASGPLVQEAYVWQRAWTPAVISGVRDGAGRLAGLTVLAGEVEWNGNTPRLIQPQLDYKMLSECGAAVSLAFRIGPWSGPFSQEDERIRLLNGWAADLLRKAKEGGLTPVELQIDFDAATSQLAGYQAWLRAFVNTAAPLPVSFTALPDWLNSPVLQEMARETGRYVLQVHAVERARLNDSAPLLMEPETARKWVERAGALGTPFRVALPTYRSAVGFNAAGKITGIDSEGPSRAWPAGVRVVTYRSPAAPLAAMVTELTADRPGCMTGVIWYRLPVPGEQRNWNWTTLAPVMAGRTPVEKIEVVRSGKNPADLTLVNTGEAEMSWPETITLRLPPGPSRIVAGDALDGYALEFDPSMPDRAVLRRRAAAFDHFLAPDGKKPLGWLRLDPDTAAHELTIVIP